MTSRFRAPHWNLAAAALLLFLGGGATGVSAPDAPPAGPPYRVGDKVTRPEKISGAAPVYTELARRAQISGTVILEAIIDEQGNVENAKVLKGQPMGLDQAAVDAVQTWKFKPATLEGRPVKVYYVLTVNFSVERDPPLGPQLQRFLKENPEFAAHVLAKRYPEAAALLDRRAPDLAAPELAIARCYLLLKQGQLEEAWADARGYRGPDSYEMLYLVGAFAWDRAYPDKVLSPDARAEMIELGLQAETMALEARGEGLEAMTLKYVLLGEKAKLTLDPAERQALMKEADQLQRQTVELQAKAPGSLGSDH
jgi:TonB family protein